MQRRLSSILLVLAPFACGRDPLARSSRDAASTTDAAESKDVPLDPEVADEHGPDPAAEHGPEVPTDACIPLTCSDPSCFPAYCGRIGDGCGGKLDCGDCAAGWSCKSGLCRPDTCVPTSCEVAGALYPYCGKIGDSCGGTLDCACPQPGWSCVGNVCSGIPSGCMPISGCVFPGYGEYCGGLIGDGCGGVLDCSRECSTADFVCKDHVCVDTRPPGPSPDPPPPPTLPPPPVPPPPPPPPPCPPPPMP